MQLLKTSMKDPSNLLVDPPDCPPLPTQIHTNIAVYIKAVPVSQALKYVFSVAMSGQKGALGWDPKGDFLIIYLKADEEDYKKCPDLQVGTELWACFSINPQE